MAEPEANLDKSGSANMEAYLDLPSSLMPFSYNNLSRFWMDASPVCHKRTPIDESSQQVHKRQKIQQMIGSASLIEPNSQSHFLIGMKQEPNSLTHLLNQSGMDRNHDYLLKQQMIQQLLLRHDVEQLQDNSSHAKGLIQQQMQQQLLQQNLFSILNSSGAHSMQSEQQMKNQLPQQATHRKLCIQSSDDGICSARLSQYIYNLQHRPKDNNIVYWRKFISEFYAPGAVERWCFSSYENIGQMVLGSMRTMDDWCCDICGTNSGKGFEASFEILSRLFKMKFDSGALGEILYLEFPRECRCSSGIMILEYGNAVQESIYEQFRVVRKGKLRVIFRHDLKILSWQFCARCHDEYVPRRLLEPLVNQLTYAAHKNQNSFSNPAPGKVSAPERQQNFNMFLKSAHKLTKLMDLPILNDLGFSKTHVRGLQIAEIVNSMKDLMDFSFKRRIGPIESLQNFPRASTKTSIRGNLQTEQENWSLQYMQTNGIRSKAMHIHPESQHSNTHVINDMQNVGSFLAHYHQKTGRENLFNTTGSTAESKQSYLMGHFSQRATSLPLQDQSFNPRPLHNTMPSRLANSQTSEASKNIQQQMIDKWLQEMVANSEAKGMQNTLGKQNQPLHTTTAWGRGTVTDGPGFGYSTASAFALANLLGNKPGSNGISRTASNIAPPRIGGNKPTIKREPDLPLFHMPEAFMGGQFSRK